MVIKGKKRLVGTQKPRLRVTMLSRAISIALIGILLVSLNSCEKTAILKDPAFSLEKMDGVTLGSKLDFQGDSSSKKFNIISSGHWDVITDEDWISVSPQSGEKNGEITITVKENAFKDREGVLKFITDTLRIDTFSVSQEGLGLILSVKPEEVKGFTSNEGDTTFAVNANGNKWEYTIDNPDWFTEKEKTDSTLTLTVAENSSDQKRETNIAFKLSDYPSFNQTVKFSQLGSALAKADLLDVIFNDDKTAKDTSLLELPVQYQSINDPVSIKYNQILKRNVAYFDPPKPGSWLGWQGSWYHVEYKDNSNFSEKLADGFTMACLVKFDMNFQTDPQTDGQTFFSMFKKVARFMVTDNDNHLVFEIGVDKDVIVNNSNIVPDNGTWYYLVGVWDKAAGKTYLYVNGEKKAEVDGVVGSFGTPPGGAEADWLCIGGSVLWQAVGNAFKGGVAIARIYDKPLAPAEINKLWTKIKQIND